MKKLIEIFALVFVVLLSSCKDDKFAGNQPGTYSEGEDALLKVKVRVPDMNRIESRALDPTEEVSLTELIFIGFEQTSGRKEIIDVTPYLGSVNEINDKYGTTYNLTENIPCKTGKYRMYIFANWSSDYAGLNVEDLKAMDETQLKSQILTNTVQSIVPSGGHGFPMSRYVENFEINTPLDQGTNKMPEFSLLRSTSLIEFRITNATTEETGSKMETKFTPRSFSIYNLPQRAAAFRDFTDDPSLSIDFNNDPNRFNVTSQPVDGYNAADDTYDFFFHMLPSVHTEGHDIDNQWYKREAWDVPPTGTDIPDFGERKFTNAPAHAPYVVITGDYIGPARQEGGKLTDEGFQGQVTFIVHLGNFSGVNEGYYVDNGGYSKVAADMNNFSVCRNEHQIYNIKVVSAHTIIANVSVDSEGYDAGELNQSIEGDLGTPTYAYVDAHYTKVMLAIPKSQIDNVEKCSVNLNTVATGWSSEYIPMETLEADTENKYDWKWVQFQKPNGTSGNWTFPVYAGIDLTTGTCLNVGGRKWGFVTDLVKDIKAAAVNRTSDSQEISGDYFVQDGDFYMTAAFIDENYYGDRAEFRGKTQSDWAGVTTKSRYMLLNPTTPVYSLDSLSIEKSGNAFAIQQYPMISPYSLENSDYTTYNPFAFEHIEEMTSTNPFSTYGFSTYPGLTWDCNDYGGPTIMAELTGSSELDPVGNNVLMFPNLATTGVDNDAQYYWGRDPANSMYKWYPHEYTKMSQALALRNRDFNGDGKITQEEMRWYIPTMSQYFTYQLSFRTVPTQLRLYQSAQDQYAGGGNADLVFPRYVTSSIARQRIWWQDQRGVSSNWESWAAPAMTIRFARNVGSFEDSYKTANTSLFESKSADRTIKVLNKNIVRQYDVTTAYPFGFATGPNNNVPAVLEYYPKAIGFAGSTSTYNGHYSKDFAYNSKTPQECLELLNEAVLSAWKLYANANTSTVGYTADEISAMTELPDGWRIPNQRELIMLLLNGVLDTYTGTTDGTYNYPTSGLAFGTSVNFFSCTYLQSNIWKARENVAFIVQNGVLDYPNPTAGYNGESYVLLVRDVISDSDSGNTEATARVKKPTLRKTIRRVR